MKYLMAIPCMDQINTMTFKSIINLRPAGDTEISVTCSSLVYDARNLLAGKAVNEGFDRVLWLDSDMTFSPDLALRLAAWLDQGYECVSGIYFRRKLPVKPVVYKDIYLLTNEHGNTPKADPYMDYPKDQLFEVAGFGFGGVMMTTDAIRRIRDVFGLPFSPILGFGEDLSFCQRAKEIGVRMYCDSSIKLGHMGMFEVNEEWYLKNEH